MFCLGRSWCAGSIEGVGGLLGGRGLASLCFICFGRGRKRTGGLCFEMGGKRSV